MAEPSRMPRYDVRNDGIGPYAVFYCETCVTESTAASPLLVLPSQGIWGGRPLGGFCAECPWSVVRSLKA